MVPAPSEKLVEDMVSLLRKTYICRNTKSAHHFTGLPHLVSPRYPPMDCPQSAAVTVGISALTLITFQLKIGVYC